MKQFSAYLLSVLLCSNFLLAQNFSNVVVNHIQKGGQNTDGGNSIAVVGDNVYLMWQDMDSTYCTFISKSTDGGITFGDGVQIHEEAPQLFGAITTNSQGHLLTAWSGIDTTREIPNGIYFSKSDDEATTFSEPVTVSENGLYTQIMSYENNVYIFYVTLKPDGKFSYFFSRSVNGGDTFETPFEISDVVIDDIKLDSPCSMFVDDLGVIYCIWNDGRLDGTGTDIFISISTDNGQTFSANTRVNSLFANDGKLRTGVGIVTDGNNLYTIWRQEDDNQATDRKIFFSRSTDGGANFSPEQEIASGGFDSPAIAKGYDGVIYLAYPNYTTSGNVLFCKYSTDEGSSFSNPVYISEESTHVKNPSIFLDPNNNVYTFWTLAGDNNEDDVVFAKGLLVSPDPEMSTSSRYYETFDSNNENGWAFLSYDAEISTANGLLQLTSNEDDLIYMFPPISATKDDFSIKITSGEASGIASGGFGRMGFKSLITLNVEDDSLTIMYTEDIQSFASPNLITLVNYPIPDGIVSLELKVFRSGNNLVVNGYVNELLFYSGQIDNADEGLFSGQLLTYIIRNENETLNWSLDEIDVSYNSFIDNENSYSDLFTNTNTPWFRFGDFDNLYDGINLNNEQLNFNYNETDSTSLFVIAPVGSIKDFTIEMDGNGGTDNNCVFGLSRFFDYLNYTTFFIEDNQLYLGYAQNSYEPTIINSVELDPSSITNLKFSVIENSGNLTLSAWINEALILTGDINNADGRLLSGHLTLGFERGNLVDGIIDNVHIDFNPHITDVEEINSMPENFILCQNYPNPFNPSTTINFALPKTGMVSLKIYNILGEEVAELINGEMKAGFQSINFNATNLSSGLYFYRISASDFVDVKKMLLLK